MLHAFRSTFENGLSVSMASHRHHQKLIRIEQRQRGPTSPQVLSESCDGIIDRPDKDIGLVYRVLIYSLLGKFGSWKSYQQSGNNPCAVEGDPRERLTKKDGRASRAKTHHGGTKSIMRIRSGVRGEDERDENHYIILRVNEDKGGGLDQAF